MSEDPIRGSVRGAYAYVDNQPTLLLDPSGKLAELYCDIIPSDRGKTKFEKAVLLVVGPTHCYLRIACAGYDSFYELYGPPKWNPKYGIPAINPFNQDRINHSTKHPIIPPTGMKCCEFEERLRTAFMEYEGEIPEYNPLGPNSNTFVQTIIQKAGGSGQFPFNAYGAEYHPDLTPRTP